uniref:Palmitoyltransferase n=1 Tax=Pyrodinium bahamense TaxID=73915 RepID=A0A7S0AUM5_9DINO|mmetsp:Transcript_42347/g.117903  ORF Transcript_42347/g.117903 Transcript_42347/m.117903 type:complete len:374 (+) Transcript_42347:126-1247(+)
MKVLAEGLKVANVLPPMFICVVIGAIWAAYVGMHLLSLLQLGLPLDFRDHQAHARGKQQLVVSQALVTLLLTCYARAFLTSPGTVPDEERWQLGSREAVESPGTRELKLTGKRRYCKWCLHYKPDRCHHCRVCKTCVLRMDHHCPITGNCIGMRNHGHFVLMYVFAILGLTYSVAVCSMAIIWGDFRIRLGTVNELALRKLQEELLSTTRSVGGIIGLAIPVLLQVVRAVGLEIALQMVFTCIAFITVLSCGLPAISMVGSGATMLEIHFPMKEYVQIKPQVYCPLGPGFYARGWRQNFKDLLGARWWLRLLLPTRGGPVDLGPAVAPRPSPAGVAALRQRCVQVEEQGVKHHVSSCKELGFDPGPGATNGAV